MREQDDRRVLQTILQQEGQKNAPGLVADKYFEVFSAEQILTKSRAFSVDLDQVKSGIMGNGGDGGVDSIYLFVNRHLVREDTDVNAFKGQQLGIELVIIQSKNKDSFGEKALTAFKDFTDNCMRLGTNLTKANKTLYKRPLLDVIARFHQIYESSLIMKPSLSITYYYASLGGRVDEKVRIRVNALVATVKEFYSQANCDCHLVGAKTLLDYYYKTSSTTIVLDTEKNISWTGFGTGYICLVKLSNFYSFITFEKTLRDYIFEANVRDYQGDNTVNKDISATLAAVGTDEFWWLNNSITIIASDVTLSGDKFTITDPLIVNGLQTSYVISRHFSQIDTLEDKRTILIRVIKNTEPKSIDRIIKATNSQTTIPRVWLHATEDIHRKIETTLSNCGMYYDRRKNYYKNKGIPATKIVTIPYMAQALAAIVLQRPDDARARPTTVAEKHYKRLFSEDQPIEIYATCAKALKTVEQFLDGVDLEKEHKLNIMFYLALYATCAALKSAKPQRQRIAVLDTSCLTDSFLMECERKVYDRYIEAGGDDKAAKGPQLAAILRSDLHERFGGRKKSGPASTI